MKKFLYGALLLSLSIFVCYVSIVYLSGKYELAGMFFAGLLAGMFLMTLKLNVKNDRINSYKRELEKEAVVSDENSAKVRVLESKIEVLEKALEKALKSI